MSKHDFMLVFAGYLKLGVCANMMPYSEITAT